MDSEIPPKAPQQPPEKPPEKEGSSSGFSVEDVERIARAVDTDRNLSEFFINSVLYQVEKNLDRRTKLRMYYTRVSVVVFFAVLAPSAWFGVKSLISTAVQTQMDAKNKDNLQVLQSRIDRDISASNKTLGMTSQKEFDKLTAKVDVETLHLSLVAAVIYLDVSQDYLREDIGFLMRNFAKAKQFPSLMQKTDFPMILDKAISSLIRMHYLNDLGQLEDLFPDIIANNPITLNRLVVFYGEQLVGSVYDPAHWEPGQVARFQRYLQLAQGSSQYVQYLPIDMLVEFQMAGQKENSTVKALLASIPRLTPEQQVAALTTLVKYSDTSFWQANPDNTDARVAAVATQFLKVYQSQLLAIAQQPVVKVLLNNQVKHSNTSAPLQKAVSQYYSVNGA